MVATVGACWGTHSSSVSPTAERRWKRKEYCNILFGINSPLLLQDHLIYWCLLFSPSQSALPASSIFSSVSFTITSSPSSSEWTPPLTTIRHTIPFIVSHSLLLRHGPFVKLSSRGQNRERGGGLERGSCALIGEVEAQNLDMWGERGTWWRREREPTDGHTDRQFRRQIVFFQEVSFICNLQLLRCWGSTFQRYDEQA